MSTSTTQKQQKLNSKKYQTLVILIFRTDNNNELTCYQETAKIRVSNDINRDCISIDAFHVGKYGTQRMFYATPNINGKLFNKYDCCMDEQRSNQSVAKFETIRSQPD